MNRTNFAAGFGGTLLSALLFWCLSFAVTGTARAQVAELDDGFSVEACIGCHTAAGAAPVADVANPNDMHYVDQDPRGPARESGYRQVNVTPNLVDVTGSQVVLTFTATDEDGNAIDNLFDSDGRFNLAKLNAGANLGDPTEWQQLLPAASPNRRTERFTTTGGLFEFLGTGTYRYTSVWDPTTVPIAAGDTLRLAVQISASDIPPGNGWCDFDASLTAANNCTSPVSLTRDIVQTETCNGCHGVTSDTMLVEHGGRTQVEYCVTCHNPEIGETEMTPLIHKIHYGAHLTMPFLDGKFENVEFTKDIDNCIACHTGGGVDEDNWKTVPNRTACASCHDDVNFDTGENHGQQPTNLFCANCHPSSGDATASLRPVPAVHQNTSRADENAVARPDEAGFYRGDGNGYSIDSLTFDRTTEELTVNFSVTRAGQKMSLQSDPRWANGARLAIDVAWSTAEYTNEGSGSTPAPAQPLSIDGLDVGGAVSDEGNGDYQAIIDMSSYGFDTVTVAIEGHPQADLSGTGSYASIPVRSVFMDFNIEDRGITQPRRQIVDIDKCNDCHDADGAGLALHGNNRVSEPQVCVLCHNPDATDIRQRPADPAMALDGKREVPIDFKRMIHGIHAGAELDEGLVVYGFGGNPHDYSTVEFPANSQNCLTCHLPGTYGAENAWQALASTTDTGADVTSPVDDLNISQVTSVCSSCHDTVRATNHMLLNGGSYIALDEDIAIAAVPEPSSLALSLTAVSTLLGLACWRRRH
jgi:OmcA/MtrC family decaheme c-type cytochrome